MNRKGLILMLVLTVLSTTACAYTDFLREYIEENATGQAISGTSVSGSVLSEETATGTAVQKDYLPQKKKASFWINRSVSKDRAMLSQDEITAFNQKIKSEYNRLLDVTEVSGEDLLAYIQKAVPQFQICYYSSGERVDQESWNQLQTLCNVDSISPHETIDYKMVMDTCTLCALPTKEALYNEQKEPRENLLSLSTLSAGEKVLSLYSSKDNLWDFVVTAKGNGWVQKEVLTLISAEEWKKSEEEDFLIVTSYTWSLYPMGTKLYLANNDEIDLEESEYWSDNFFVKDGKIIRRIPMGSNVSLGYLEYTPSNLLTQLFECLGFKNVNVSTVYSCFGLQIPASGDGLKEITENQDLTVAANAATPGALIHTSHGLCAYIGTMDNQLYMIGPDEHGVFSVQTVDKKKLSESIDYIALIK